MTIKHEHHAARLDGAGSDTWRHFTEGKAERTLLAGEEERVLFERAPDLYDPVALARRYLTGADVILVEGFKRSPLPKIEVWRRSLSEGPLYDEASSARDQWLALMTDDDRVRAGCRVLRFNDTMWLHLLATLILDEGLELDA
jgi:molybdopterin-guanine dinucleotide biosynthesis protein B